MRPLDWLIVAAFLAASLGIGTAASRRAGRGFGAFFLGDRRLPWWMLGVSMVATTFSTDTPNLVTDIVRSDGVLGNWVWWAFALTGLSTTFVYARLWRRSGMRTDVEFYEIRYSGRLAAFLRGFRAVYLGVLFNVLILASVTLAAIKISAVLLGLSPFSTVTLAALVTTTYSVLGGLRGVVLTDLVQFAVSMAGSFAAAAFLVGLPEVGGLEALLRHEQVADRLRFWPSFAEADAGELVPLLLLPLGVQWWASYYPGAEPGGGGYVAQRMLAARSERAAEGASLLFNALHYALRPWPWILVALSSLVVFPDLDAMRARFPDLPEHVVRNDLAYPAMLTLLPAGLLGLVAASLAAAYMSTMSTQVNWGAGVLVNDVYQRFVRPEASERELVLCGRVVTVGLMLLACTLALWLDSALQVFSILLQIGAGTGLLFLLRWFWWRINAATELAAMLVSLTVAVGFELTALADWPAWQKLSTGVAVTTASWLLVAFLTPPTDRATLLAFYRRIRPDGPGWREIRAAAGDGPHGDGSLPRGIAATVAGALFLYAGIFATGFWLYGRVMAAGTCLAFALACGGLLFGIVRRLPADPA